MNLWYKRKSNLNYNQTISNALKILKENGFEIIGTKEFDNISIISFLKPKWLDLTLKLDEKSLIFLPFNLFIFKGKNDDSTYINIFNPEIIEQILHQQLHQNSENSINHEHKELDFSENIFSLIKKITANENRKIKKIKLYATLNCPYCKMEQAWLKENNIQYEIAYVDLNQKEGELMVQKTGQLGVPVTEIIFEDDDEEYIIGFDKNQLNKILIEQK